MDRSPAPGESRRTRERLAYAGTAALFVLSRALAWIAGVRFDASPLPRFFQYVDPELLASEPLRSLFYLHAQPPAFNAFLALVLHVAPDRSTSLFAALYAASGLALAFAILALSRRLGAPLALAFALSAVWIVSPAALLYENWLFYDYPVAAMLVFAALFLHRFGLTARMRDAVPLFTLLALVPLTRSLFHPLWTAGAGLAAVLAAPRAFRRRAILLASISSVFAAAPAIKNGIVFGTFESSSWSGMNLARIALEPTPLASRREMVDSGRLSPVALAPPFSALEAYPAELTDRPIPPVPVLDRRLKSTGARNMNHFAYLAVSAEYRRASLVMIAERPGTYLHAVTDAGWIYAQSSTRHWFLFPNRRHIEAWDGFFEFFLLGALARPLALGEPSDVPGFPLAASDALYGWMLLGLLATISGARRGLRELRRREGGNAASADGATRLFLVGTVVYVTLVANLFELGENNRMRFLVDPLLLVLAGTLVAPLLADRSRFPRFRRFLRS